MFSGPMVAEGMEACRQKLRENMTGEEFGSVKKINIRGRDAVD